MAELERVVGARSSSHEAQGEIYTVGIKPRLRGVPDVIATVVAVPFAAFMIAWAKPGTATVAAVVYGISLVFLFATSATYHTPLWPMSIRRIWRRLDHSAIYVLIAGSYTPFCLLGLPSHIGTPVLWVVWTAAVLGFVKSFLWEHAPRALNTAIYIGLGWLVLPFVPTLYAHIGVAALSFIAAGGLLYSVGAVVYVKRWPNPWPAWFGYHEIFHLFVVGAGICHFVAMWQILV